MHTRGDDDGVCAWHGGGFGFVREHLPHCLLRAIHTPYPGGCGGGGHTHTHTMHSKHKTRTRVVKETHDRAHYLMLPGGGLSGVALGLILLGCGGLVVGSFLVCYFVGAAPRCSAGCWLWLRPHTHTRARGALLLRRTEQLQQQHAMRLCELEEEKHEHQGTLLHIPSPLYPFRSLWGNVVASSLNG